MVTPDLFQDPTYVQAPPHDEPVVIVWDALKGHLAEGELVGVHRSNISARSRIKRPQARSGPRAGS